MAVAEQSTAPTSIPIATPPTSTVSTVAVSTVADVGAVRSIELPFEGGTVEVTDAGVWVFPHLDPVALRVDPETLEIDLTVELASPSADTVLGDGVIWIWTEGDRSSYVALDPRSGEIASRVTDVAAGAPAFGFGQVWAAADDGTIARIDPATGELARISAQSGGSFLLTSGVDKVWTLGADGLVGIDPTNGQATEPWRPITVIGERPTLMRATATGTLLFANPTGIHEVDPISHTLLQTFPLPAGTIAQGPVDPGGGLLHQPSFMFVEPAHSDPPRGEPVPDVVIATVDVATGSLSNHAIVPFTEGARIVDSVLWTTPLRTPQLLRVPLST